MQNKIVNVEMEEIPSVEMLEQKIRKEDKNKKEELSKLAKEMIIGQKLVFEVIQNKEKLIKNGESISWFADVADTRYVRENPEILEEIKSIMEERGVRIEEKITNNNLELKISVE